MIDRLNSVHFSSTDFRVVLWKRRISYQITIWIILVTQHSTDEIRAILFHVDLFCILLILSNFLNYSIKTNPQILPYDHEHYPNAHHQLPELIYTKPPKGHPSEYLHGNSVPPHQAYGPPDWELSGPGLGSEWVIVFNLKSHHIWYDWVQWEMDKLDLHKV